MEPVKRKLAQISGKSYCLLCSTKMAVTSSSTTSKGDISDFFGVKREKFARMADFGVDIVGGQSCTPLVTQLEQMFVLLKVLDVPVEWCEQMLSNQGEVNEVTHADTGRWFSVCGDCVEKNVVKAWEVFQQIVALKGRMASIKSRVKEGMRRGIESCRGNGRTTMEGTTDYEIRKLLFPELFIKAEVASDSDVDACDLFQIELDNLSSVPEFKADQTDATLLDSPVKKERKMRKRRSPNKIKATAKRRRRAPGRPRHTPQLPENLYLTRTYGVVKQKRFHWKICTDCNARYKSQEEYDAHRLAHEQFGGGEFACSQCTFPARSAEELEFHRKNRHEKQGQERRTYLCPKCPLKTDIWKHLKHHVDTEHPTMTQEELTAAGLILKCELCGGRVFESLSNLRIHQKKVHTELELIGKTGDGDGGPVSLEPIPCPDCGIKFASNQHLEYHVQNTHKRQSRFVCDQCGTGFQFHSQLETHKISHLDRSQKRQLICHLCGLDYVNKQLLRVHYAKCHPASSTTASSESAPSTSGEVFKCRYCDLTSPIAVVIKRHLETHKEEMGFRCEQCSKCYTSAQGLSRHLRINHSNESWSCPYCSKTFPCEEYVKDHIKRFCKLKGLEQGQPVKIQPVNGEERMAAVENDEALYN